VKLGDIVISCLGKTATQVCRRFVEAERLEFQSHDIGGRIKQGLPVRSAKCNEASPIRKFFS
jgi:hypothetical protein